MPADLIDNEARLAAALDYAQRGWRVVALYGVREDGACECRAGAKCDSAGKHPRLAVWQKHATIDPAVVADWWETWPLANVGVQMGEASGLIDLECDSAAAEQVLAELFDGEPPVVPTFVSGRGKHRLFKWRTGFPLKATVGFGGLDIKLGMGDRGSQSVFPPSRRAAVLYRWLPGCGPDDCPLGEITDAVLARIQRALHGKNGQAAPPAGGRAVCQENEALLGPEVERSARHKLYEQESIGEGQRNEVLYAEACAAWGEQVRLYGAAATADHERQAAVHRRIWSWNMAMCKPPLTDEELFKLVESARAFISQQAGETQQEGANLTALGLELRDGEWWPGAWRTETSTEAPHTVRLFAPFLPKRFIELTTDDFDSPGKVHRAVLAATGSVCLAAWPGFWESIWNGQGGDKRRGQRPRRGVKSKLAAGTTWYRADADVRRSAVIAERLLAALANARVAVTEAETGKPDLSGRAIRLPDGGVLFGFGKVWEDLSLGADKVTRHELSTLLLEVGATNKATKAGGKFVRLKCLDAKALARLTAVVGEPLSE
jgi:hypothetical protein